MPYLEDGTYISEADIDKVIAAQEQAKKQPGLKEAGSAIGTAGTLLGLVGEKTIGAPIAAVGAGLRGLSNISQVIGGSMTPGEAVKDFFVGPGTLIGTAKEVVGGYKEPVTGTGFTPGGQIYGQVTGSGPFAKSTPVLEERPRTKGLPPVFDYYGSNVQKMDVLPTPTYESGTGQGRADYQGAPFATGNIGPGGEGGAPTTQPTVNEAIQSMAGAPSTISGPDLLKSAVEKNISPQGIGIGPRPFASITARPTIEGPTAATAGQITAGTYDTAGTQGSQKPGMATPISRPSIENFFNNIPVDIATPISKTMAMEQALAQQFASQGMPTLSERGGDSGGGGGGIDSSVVGGYDTAGMGIVDAITGGMGPGGGGGDIASQIAEATSMDASGIGGDAEFGALAGGGSLSSLLRGYYG